MLHGLTIRTIAFALLCVLSLSASAQPNSIVRIQTDMLTPSVRVNDNCSGTIIKSQRDDKTGDVVTYVLTAKHCLAGKSNVANEVDIPVYSDGNRLIAEHTIFANVWRQDRSSDLAILVLLDRQTIYAPVAVVAAKGSAMYAGTDVWASGYPRGVALTLTRGILNHLVRAAVAGTPEREYYHSTASVSPGSSGGGLYRQTESGGYEIIGMVSARSAKDDYLTLITPLADIHRFAARVLQ